MARNRAKKQKSNNNLFIGGLAAIILIVAAVLAFTAKAPTDTAALPAEISVQEAYSTYLEGTFILDVRTQEEWNDGHIPGATLIPLDQLESRMDELPRGQAVVVLCRSGNRSAVGRDILLGAGFESVTSVAGGFNQWTANDYPIEYGP